MRIFALDLDNDIQGIELRKEYIESLVSALPSPDLVVLPEMSLCGYMADQDAWELADDCGRKASEWATEVARRHDTHIGVGYIDREGGDYYNRYLIAGPDGVCGTVTKSEGEAAVFRRGDFDHVIDTPFGRVAVAICYDSRRRHFYEAIEDEELSLIVFPHGSPADPLRPVKEREDNFARCMEYVWAFGVPVVYANSFGELAHMPGIMGRMMEQAGFRMNGMSRICANGGEHIDAGIPEAVGMDVELVPRRRLLDIEFHGEDILPGNWLFRHVILPLDTQMGIRSYEANKGAVPPLSTGSPSTGD